jgi:hypothetical protein
MKTLILTLFLIFNGILNVYANPWGFFAHKKINYLAVFMLPTPLNKLYKREIHLLQEYAVLPDERRYVMDNEAQRHYIDLDHYELKTIEFKNFKQLSKTIPEDSLNAHGIVVWYIPIAFLKLKKAFQVKDWAMIIKYSAELGHYVADAHVPLHTTSNYDGQKTGQSGIHAFWESRIPELLNNELEEWLGPAEYIQNVELKAWEYVLSSNSLVQDLLTKEKELALSYSNHHKYSFEQKGNSLVKNYAKDYALAYHKLLRHTIEDRFSESVKQVASLWYTAWLEAGQPDIP